MQKRNFCMALSALGLGFIAASGVAASPAVFQTGQDYQMAVASIEKELGGRIGVSVAMARDADSWSYRGDERFPMCSTFKWLAAAHVLHEVDARREQLDRRVRFGAEVLLPWSPVTEKHADGSGMTLGELCLAAIATSDNAAGNLLLHALGGPGALTAFVRALGDPVTRLDRWEPELNQSLSGDPRDTTSPRAMAGLLKQLVLGDALSANARRQLAQWLMATTTNAHRLGAGVPRDWALGSKTGTGPHGSTSDVGVYWPPAREPLAVAVYITESGASLAAREAAIAQIARWVVQSVR